MPVQTTIRFRQDTAANWTSTNPTLAAGELGFETDTNRFKIGDGSTAWASLSYQGITNYLSAVGMSSTALDIPSRYGVSGAITVGSGYIVLSTFTPLQDFTASNISMASTSAVTAGTLTRMGLFTWDDSTATATLVARTANDTTIFTAATTVYTRAFDTTGGYPASYTLKAGTRYAIGFICVGSTGGTVLAGNTSSTITQLLPRVAYAKSGQTDLANFTGGGSGTTNTVWGRLT